MRRIHQQHLGIDMMLLQTLFSPALRELPLDNGDDPGIWRSVDIKNISRTEPRLL
jgi:hypothetical protein